MVTSEVAMRSALFLLFLVAYWGLGAEVGGGPSEACAENGTPETQQSVPDVSAFQTIRNTRGDLAAVEMLWQVAREGRLARPLLKQAAGLLDHQDPFVSGVAEWAIAVQIGYENNGVRQLWPPSDPPPWYARWQKLPCQLAAERDYVRQAVARGIHRDSEQLQISVARIVDRARAVAAEIRGADTSPDTLDMIDRQLKKLDQLRGRTDAILRSGNVQVGQLRRRRLRDPVHLSRAPQHHARSFLVSQAGRRHLPHSRLSVFSRGDGSPWRTAWPGLRVGPGSLVGRGSHRLRLCPPATLASRSHGASLVGGSEKGFPWGRPSARDAPGAGTGPFV